WVEWDPSRNPERHNPALLQVRTPVRIGEPSSHAINRTVVVESVTRAAEDIVRLRLVSPDGKPLPHDKAIPGGRSVGVPGQLRLMEAAHRDHGT
ncbi:hypothetical protein ABTJ37_20490, partial [Acinetobacter baumannii]